MYITENTVKKHITSLLSKLGVKRRTEVALYATKIWRRKGELDE
ncbi:MAG: response regulator transcription factor [Clostridiales bacterium]|nr:response regulator transcription factor [Clostridiales bacterium]